MSAVSRGAFLYNLCLNRQSLLSTYVISQRRPASRLGRLHWALTQCRQKLLREGEVLLIQFPPHLCTDCPRWCGDPNLSPNNLSLCSLSCRHAWQAAAASCVRHNPFMSQGNGISVVCYCKWTHFQMRQDVGAGHNAGRDCSKVGGLNQNLQKHCHSLHILCVFGAAVRHELLWA